MTYKFMYAVVPFEFKDSDGNWYPLSTSEVLQSLEKAGYEARPTPIDNEREMFDEWFFGKGISSYAEKMSMWAAWDARSRFIYRN